MSVKKFELSDDTLESGCMVSIFQSSVSYGMKRHHTHNHYEILHVSPIVRKMLIEDDMYYISNNSVAFVKPNVPHMTYSENITYYKRYLLSFTDDFIKPFVDLFGFDLDEIFGSPARSYSDTQTDQIHAFFNELNNEQKNNNGKKKTQKFMLIFANFLSCLQDGVPLSPMEIRSNTFQTVLDYISHMYNERLTLDYLSEHFYISKSNLCHQIKTHTGKTFSQYLCELRITKACEYLKTTTNSLTNISALVGYPNPSLFAKDFKKITSITPTQYRKQYSNILK